MEPTTDPPVAQAEMERPPCPAPARIRHEVASFDARAETGRWDGPDYRMTFRSLGEGPPLFVVPGIASTYHVYALFLNQLSTRFRTIIYDYPGEHVDDGAKLGRITHDNLVDHLFGLIDHLNIGRAFLTGLSFGSTVVLKSLEREPRRFPRAAVQGAFAHRRFSAAERLALCLGRLVPGKAKRLPLRRQVLTYNGRPEFPADPRGPLAVLSRKEWRYTHSIAGTSRRPADPARPSPVLEQDHDRDPADPGPRRSHRPPTRFRAARVVTSPRRGLCRAHGRSCAAPHPCRAAGAINRQLAAALRPSRLRASVVAVSFDPK